MLEKIYRFQSPPYTHYVGKTLEGKQECVRDRLNCLPGEIPDAPFLGSNGALCRVRFDYSKDRTRITFENGETWRESSGRALNLISSETFHMIASISVSPPGKDFPLELRTLFEKHQYKELNSR